jgi:hypothetical protein
VVWAANKQLRKGAAHLSGLQILYRTTPNGQVQCHTLNLGVGLPDGCLGIWKGPESQALEMLGSNLGGRFPQAEAGGPTALNSSSFPCVWSRETFACWLNLQMSVPKGIALKFGIDK